MVKKAIDWSEVQKLYDAGKTIRECGKLLGFSADTARKAGKSGLLNIRSKRDCQNCVAHDAGRIEALVAAYHAGATWHEIIGQGFKQAEYQWSRDTGLLTPRTPAKQAAERIRKFGPNRPGEEARKATSLRQSLNNSGGKCQWFEVAGQKVQGTWERDFAKELEYRKLEWRKPKVNSEVLQYSLDGRQKTYTPDFYLPEFDLYIEVKGYWWGRDKEKMDAVKFQHPDVKILIVEKSMFEDFMLGKQIW